MCGPVFLLLYFPLMEIAMSLPHLSKRTVARIFLFSATAGALTGLFFACGTDQTINDANEIQDFSRGNIFGTSMKSGTLSLTFDDGPTAQTLPIATYLRDEGIQATFFMNGKNIAGRESVVRQVAAMGHLIANHSWSHFAMSGVGDPVAEVRRTDDLIKGQVAGSNFLFRAPFGDWRGNVADIINETGMRKYVGPIFWDVGGELRGGYAADWACWGNGLSARSCGDGYLREIDAKGRGIVLMHDVDARTTEMVRYMVPILKKEGYAFQRTDLVPGIASQLRALGAKPGAGISAPPDEPYFCLQGGSVQSIGNGGLLCRLGNEAVGPFPEGMRQNCADRGGGSACNRNNWNWNFAQSVYGDGNCPRGAARDSVSGYCAEGSNAFGPFPVRFVEKCLSQGGGETTCRSGRWSLSFLRNIAASF
jgi:peptidoglycan/xylan/chitin deacetylase (PgdA/CDA1 family)